MADTRVPNEVLLQRLGMIEQTVTKLDKHANEQLVAPKLHVELRRLVGSFEPEETAPVAAAPAPVAAAPVASPLAATPSVETLQSNSTLADEILMKVEATGEKIEKLAAAGRKFNASAANADLYKIANRVAEILNNVDLAQPWVQNDLSQLADEANKIHDLFAPAKV